MKQFWKHPLGRLFAAALMACSAGAAAAGDVEPSLAQSLAAGATADYVVMFEDTTDLTRAFAMQRLERRRFVVNALRATAERSQAPAIALVERAGLRHRTFINGNELYVFDGDAALASSLASLPGVKGVRPTITIALPPVTVETAPAANGEVTWGLNDSKAPDFWAAFATKGAGIVVANIDSGVQWNHPALVDQFNCPGTPTDPKCWSDPSNICGAAGACDNNGHGTHTMGTMVAADNPALSYVGGMAPGAKWIACKGCESSSCSDLALNSCADWILAPGGNPDNAPDVVNNSWGGGGGDDWYLPKVQAWRAAGIFPAFSAGNSGSRCRSMGSPGDYQESFASAAHDVNRTIASFSSRGPGRFGHDPYTKPNISAPGVDVISTVPNNGWASYNGTSMASPHTAGAVALLWACNPDLVGNIDGTIQILQNSTDGPAPAGNCDAPPDGEGNYTYGYGYLNVLAAGNAACGGGGGETMHVADILPFALCQAGLVAAGTRIVDEGGTALAEASVSGTWVLADGSVRPVSKPTNTSGRAWLITRNVGPGTYRFCVDAVSKSGYTYDAAGNVETCDSVTYACE